MSIDPFEQVFRRLGGPADAFIVREEIVNLYTMKLPIWLRNFWQTRGIGSYRDGYFWLCLPSEFESLLAEILSPFPDLDANDFYVFRYTADSVLYVLDRTGNVYWVYMNLSYIISFLIDDGGEKRGSGILPGLLAATKWMDDDLSMHTEASIKLGVLNRDEVYGFFPALQLGGQPEIANLRKTQAAAHWSFLAQLEPFRFRSNRQ